MEDQDNSYAPESPDLSSYYSHQPEPQTPAHQTTPQHAQHYPPSRHPFRGSVSTPYIPPGAVTTPSAATISTPQHATASSTFAPPHEQPYNTYQPQLYSNTQSSPYQPGINPVASYNQPIDPFYPPYDSPYGGAAMPPRRAKKVTDDDDDWAPESAIAPQSQMQHLSVASNGASFGGLDAPAGPGTENIEVRTKFPVARIKRIMQADDDVGKVAQVTPVAVSKALELFMISIVTKAASEAKSKSSKRVTSQHLKAAVLKDDQFDFLQATVGKVADNPASTKRERSDDEAEDTKKKKGGTRRKRKEGSEEL